MCGRNEVEAAEEAMGCTVGIGHYPCSPSAAGGTRWRRNWKSRIWLGRGRWDGFYVPAVMLAEKWTDSNHAHSPFSVAGNEAVYRALFLRVHREWEPLLVKAALLELPRETGDPSTRHLFCDGVRSGCSGGMQERFWGMFELTVSCPWMYKTVSTRE